jgi:HEAT repeat protein
MNRHGKVIAFSTAAVGVVILVAAGFVSKPWFVEQYYIHNLQSTDEGARLRAVGALVDVKSVRAVPQLIRLLQLEQGGGVSSEDKTAHWAACLNSLADISLNGSRNVEPMLIEALRDDSPVVRTYACYLLSLRKTASEKVVLSLQESLRDDDSKVSQAAAVALKKIQGTQDEQQR